MAMRANSTRFVASITGPTVTKDDSPEAQIPLGGRDEGFESF